MSWINLVAVYSGSSEILVDELPTTPGPTCAVLIIDLPLKGAPKVLNLADHQLGVEDLCARSVQRQLSWICASRGESVLRTRHVDPMTPMLRLHDERV